MVVVVVELGSSGLTGVVKTVVIVREGVEVEM